MDSKTDLSTGHYWVSVPYRSSPLSVTVRAAASPPVLAIHGISSHSRLWKWLLISAPSLTLIMPDLDGRGASFDASRPSTTLAESVSPLDSHADDMSHVIKHFGLAGSGIDVLGMSMGGFAAVRLAARHRSLVQSLTLVDGGPPMKPPRGLDKDNIVEAFQDRTERLGREWSVSEYVDFFAQNSGPLVAKDKTLEEYLSYDLGLDGGESGQGKVRLSPESLVSDAKDVFFGDSKKPLDDQNVKSVPTRIAVAAWSCGKGSPPAYTAEDMESWKDRVVSIELAEELDHAGIIMTTEGSRIVTKLLEQAVGMQLH